MKKLFRQTVGISVTGALAISLVACGGNSDQEPKSSGAPGSEASAPKPELRTLQGWMKDDYNRYPVAKLLEERTGYKVQYDMLPQDNPQEKLNLLIASSESYDAITTSGVSTYKAMYSDYAKRGALVDLGPLIDKYGPNIKAAISQESLDAVKIDGKIYAIPSKTLSNVASSFMIRQDWLDKLGLKMPTTTEEFVNVLKAFKEQDPGGNKDKNIPFSIWGNSPIEVNLAGAFGLSSTWNDVGGKLLPRALDPSYKDFLVYMNDLFKQGLLDKEFVVNKYATVSEKFTSGKVGVMPVDWGSVPALADALAKNVPGAKMAYIPAMKGPQGKMGLPVPTGFDRLTFIPKAAKHPEDAIKWINAKLEPDTFRLMTIGEENKHFTYKNGAYTPILPIFTDERNVANNFMSGSDEKNYPSYWQARVRKDQRLFDAYAFLNIQEPANTRIPDPIGMSPYLAVYAKNNESLNAMLNDQTVKFIAGAEPISNLDAFIAKYKAAGGDASYKEVNDWYATLKK
ncbi:extracellular solute-binding protein [Paenibacillus mesophilus]|uniref:extracellular solute-binding protein n=1 Tax=Paenibacillus mesophilus TaxID=2582849 RepID=UPI00110DF0D1|nr:extracellular solute-binding protein [Paenibacillus mesophilus]TMV47876.1 extracellular solute-binding protein [Paenibacillus mesophilus]